MVKIDAFTVEQWMDHYENTPGVLNTAETCCASVSVDDLVHLSEDKNAQNPLLTTTKLTYGAILGSQVLRERVAALCSGEDGPPLDADDVIITTGAINANFLLLYTLIGPGDHVVCVYPTYQQLYSVPESLGAEVSLWKLKPENGWIPDLKELEGLVKHNTKMIIVNNPNNPSGVPMSTSVMQQIADFAREKNVILLSDEVYRPLFHDGFEGNASVPKPALALGYPRTIVTGSMSKAYALAGIRLGWVASRDRGMMAAIAAARDYTTISVSRLDDQVASFALSPAVQGPLLRRNVALARHNRSLLAAFVERHADVCSWVEPSAGTTAFVQFRRPAGGQPVVDTEFCIDLLEKTKVFFVPGSHCFGRGVDFKGYVRIGYVCETPVLEEALQKLDQYLMPWKSG